MRTRRPAGALLKATVACLLFGAVCAAAASGPEAANADCRTILQREVTFDVRDSVQRESVVFYEVPPGARLVVEHVSVLVRLRFPAIIFAELIATSGSQAAVIRIPLKNLGQSRDDHVYLNDRLVRAYADGGTRASIGIFRFSSGATGVVQATVSGYVVDQNCPVADWP